MIKRIPAGIIPRRLATALVALLCVSTVLSGCSTSKGRGREQRYDLKGKVVSVDKSRREVTIDHETIPGFMEAMVMPFPLKDADALGVVEAGDLIQATLVVADDGYWLEDPRITKGLGGGAPPPAAGPQPGDELPDASLVNQDAKPVRLSSYRGRALLLTFFYARCRDAEFCPLTSEHFAELHRAISADEGLMDKTLLLSVSIDPEHDTPAALRSYGGAYTQNYSGEKYERWQFVTGEPAEIKRLAQFFGLQYTAEKDQLVHTRCTAIIDPSGRVRKIYRDNDWQTADVLKELRATLSENR
jgi:protein SCO1/2